MKRHALLLAVACALGLGTAAPLDGQEMPENRVLLRVSPLGLVFNTFKVGGELMVTPNLALDAMVNHNREWLWTDINITTGMVGARYYPSAAFQEFSVAGHLGGIRIDADEDISNALFHIELAYGWLMGDARRFHVAAAVGAMRVFASGTVQDPDDEDWDWNLSIPIPTGRLQIGYRF